ncbi:hypothetical protein M8C21_004330 [Ambrosia artemisiifolia]|uniref:At3g05675-like ankyrin-like domain-containing protein n=1 Tax=Ambrosia artemisiifolia TaxID=4212 RepID=A0AAD5BSY2_AMBAR|nr:hypothetical protein M8C21_004330 [Ambrosia artemisiifolia]
MAEIRIKKIKNVPIAVTPDGFWCCPSHVMFPKTLNKPKSSSSLSSPTKASSNHKKHSQELDTKPSPVVVDEPPVVCDERKVFVEFGEPGTGDLKVVLLGKQGIMVRLSVHRHVVEENSAFFAKKLLGQHASFDCVVVEVDECEDVESYVETVGLMYCKELDKRLIKQSVSNVLRILKVAEQLGFKSCMESCLNYLEAVPWVGEEEERVVSSVLRLQHEGLIGVGPILKRVTSDGSKPTNDTISHVLQLVLKSKEEKGRREMKSVVSKLLKEDNDESNPNSNPLTSVDLRNDTVYTLCTTQLAQPEFTQQVVKQMVLEADNMLWLLDVLANRCAADTYAVIWANQQELARLHPQVPIMYSHHISCITARLFVGIGRGEILPCKDTRHLLLKTWLQPLIDDYSWLQHGCKSFDRKVVDEGIGRTILTLPLADQQIIFLGWLSSYLKAGDNCPNLQKAFEVWWRRTFVRPYTEQSNSQQLD